MMTKSACMWLGMGLALASVGAAAQTVTGSGTTNTVPVFTGTSTVGNSHISVSGSNVGIGTTNPGSLLEVQRNQHGVTGVRVTNTDMTSGDYGTQAGYWIYGTASNASIGSLKWVPQLLSGAGAIYLTTESNYPLAFGSNSSPTPSMIISTGGAVGIGTTSPGAALEVNGTGIKLTYQSGGSITFADNSVQTTAWNGVLNGGDYAESVNISGDRSSYAPGDIIVISSTKHGTFAKSAAPYSTLVAGIYSTKPGLLGRRQSGDLKASTTEIPMAMVGIVPTKVSTENGPIKDGDLLVTSSTPGVAMKGTDSARMMGAVIGKAMDSLDSGSGVIEVLVRLQ